MHVSHGHCSVESGTAANIIGKERSKSANITGKKVVIVTEIAGENDLHSAIIAYSALAAEVYRALPGRIRH